MTPAPGRRLLQAGLLIGIGAIALGVLLRLWNLGPQVMSDDELHGVRAALGNPVPRILVTYQRVDNTIPLTAFYRLLLDCGMKLTETVVRLPAVISGLLLLVLAPLWVARRLGWGTAVVFAALLAISPGLIFYSRIARSYAPIVLLGFGAAVAFEAWWRRPGWRMGIAYVLLAALAVWFHLGAAPFVVAPFLYGLADGLRRRDLRRLLILAGLGAATALAFLAFLVPARESLGVLIAEKHGELHLSWRLILDVLRLQAGTGWPWVAALFWVAAVLGLVLLTRTDHSLAGYSAVLVLGHLAGLLILAPQGHEHPLILGRYLLIALPWVLLWVAVALTPRPPLPVPRAHPPRERGRLTGASAAVAVLFMVLLALAGPFVDPKLWRSSFAHHNDHMALMWPRSTIGPRQVPRFYRELPASEPGAVLEYPWHPVWRLNRAFYLYQELHGRQVVVAPARVVLADERIAFRNMVAGTPEGFLASRARWLVVHRNLSQEEARVQPSMEVDPRHRALFRSYGHGMVLRLYGEWGKPDHIDRRMAVWDLARVRREVETPQSVGTNLPGEHGRGVSWPQAPPTSAARRGNIDPLPGFHVHGTTWGDRPAVGRRPDPVHPAGSCQRTGASLRTRTVGDRG
ncbi:MAG TPA: glycosyltransferase family 39 protein [Thermoanaerobaculia bacterium]|nr:glycosyltransferase family 39 protein [Thermoanaerobaculia bacterium]